MLRPGGTSGWPSPERPKPASLWMRRPTVANSVTPFVNIARHLTGIGLRAPDILAEDASNGFLLLEDFGDSVFARMIDADPRCESALYEAAVDVLIALHGAPIPDGLVSFTPALMAEQAALVLETYADMETRKLEFQGALETVLTRSLIPGQVLILRDYHAENLIWLPDGDGIQRVGLLDFQDAMAGPVGYDLVSLLHDARRDVPGDLADRMVARFTAAVGLDLAAFKASRAALCAQRNLRILGIFARLSRQQGKTAYVDLIPRVWAHLQHVMAHPALAPLTPIIANLPPPTPDHLARLRMPCAPIFR